jgi:hypothetical protein
MTSVGKVTATEWREKCLCTQPESNRRPLAYETRMVPQDHCQCSQLHIGHQKKPGSSDRYIICNLAHTFKSFFLSCKKPSGFDPWSFISWHLYWGLSNHLRRVRPRGFLLHLWLGGRYLEPCIVGRKSKLSGGPTLSAKKVVPPYPFKSYLIK